MYKPENTLHIAANGKFLYASILLASFQSIQFFERRLIDELGKRSLGNDVVNYNGVLHKLLKGLRRKVFTSLFQKLAALAGREFME